MKKRMLLVAICSVILSLGIANAQPRKGHSSGHTRSEIHHSPAPKPIAKVNHKPAPAPKPIAKVNHKPAPVPPPSPAPRYHAHHRPAPVPPPPPAPRHHAHHGHHTSCAYCINHRPMPVPPPHAPAPRRVVHVASPVTTAATVAGVAVVAGLLGAAIASK